MKKLALSLLVASAVTTSGLTQPAPTTSSRWPAITQQTKPWTRWWWMGSAVTPGDLTTLLTQYQQAGLGGVEITPIYGVKGTEQQFINFLSPTWMDRLDHTLTEAKRLNLGVDMAQASGWPFGGPWVSPADACKYVTFKTYTLKPGQRLSESVTYVQQPMVRAVDEAIAIEKLADPVAKNPDLQRHAFDQVRFQKPLPLQTLMAYGNGQALDLTRYVDTNGQLTWTAPIGATEKPWTLYAVFQGWHGKQVERAGPGGEGDVIDHFSKAATQHYLQRFDKAFTGRNIGSLRAFFNDSYEVDDAQGEANWTPALFTEFAKRRGYDLKQHLPELFDTSDEQHRRVLSDYRETIAELILENYTRTWHDWAKNRGKIIRNQAHGSPANILDLYTETDIPEIEGTDLLRIKFASSAANVTGKPLISSESATWDNEHFLSTLSDVKKDLDLFLLGGVNHMFYHGTNYSPPQAEWPGWLFYAAVHVNPNNSFWTDFSKLNQYVARCQSFLQRGKPDNEVLVYLPTYDAYAQPVKQGKDRSEPRLLQHFDGIEHGFKELPVAHQAETLLQKGYSFDFISDKQLTRLTTANGRLVSSGGATYRTILLPNVQYMPLATLQQLVKLAQQGATIIVAGKMPTNVPGLGKLAERQQAFDQLIKRLAFSKTDKEERISVGKGAFLRGSSIDSLLTRAGVNRESLVDRQLQVIRRRFSTSGRQGHYYFILNSGDKPVGDWVSLATNAQSATLFNPMTEQTGRAAIRKTSAGLSDVYLQLAPGESCILETTVTGQHPAEPAFVYQQAAGKPQPLSGTWTVDFVSGGPTKPASVTTSQPGSWTDLPSDGVKVFSGAASYSLTFPRPAGHTGGWQLDLGKVAESARVQLNGQELATLIGPTYQLTIPGSLLQPTNKLTITVSNGMANRIADLDKRHVNWKKFYNINMSARLKENRGKDGLFTAENWQPHPSGLLGPVTLTPLSSLPLSDR
ncbi:glycosyl hydrolase [Spirosoma sp. KUDC1026]|uniref:glycosyl hydrolase n=1 Tax=Spirosoma sp. KUDC1026 TaxID=2745947 RepID=UPI00159BD84D|nr:glycosyl hydrolase [Spirosoma sp. KUDC1026]QKZ14364.1 glycoside hydrolase family 2 protein [Spirosoma sp. KUDC1026]